MEDFTTCSLCAPLLGSHHWQIHRKRRKVMSEKASTVYISGAITGINNYQEHFKKAEDHIKSFGLKTLNHVEFCKGMENKAKEMGVTLEWGDYMRKCLVMIPAADAMYMLRGWEKSKGARLEHHIAQELGIEILYQGGENA